MSNATRRRPLRFDAVRAVGRLLHFSVFVSLGASRGLGAEVALRLESVTVGMGCGAWNYGCGDPNEQTPVAVSPLAPTGNGTIDLDEAGAFIRGTLSLESHTRDGAVIAAWTRTLEPSDLARQDFLLRESTDVWGDVDLVVEIFMDRNSFSGRLTHTYEYPMESGAPGDYVVETYSFSTLPAPPPPQPSACQGLRLYLDEDGDGEEDSRDFAPPGATNPSFGTRVDGAGRTIADFCALYAGSRQLCTRLDFSNDEPLRKRPRDCKPSGTSCEPAQLMPPASPPPFSGPTCQGLPVFADADADGESDVTDRCADSAALVAIDDNGCSVEQFCALQPTAACKRADFVNDEPGRKRPRDCVRTQQQCRAAAP